MKFVKSFSVPIAIHFDLNNGFSLVKHVNGVDNCCCRLIYVYVWNFTTD